MTHSVDHLTAKLQVENAALKMLCAEAGKAISEIVEYGTDSPRHIRAEEVLTRLKAVTAHLWTAV